MTDQRVGRHVRIYEWDEVDIEDDTTAAGIASDIEELTKMTAAEQKPKQEQSKEQGRGLSGLLRRKLF